VLFRSVAEAVGVGHFSAGSFSESVRVFDPERLKPIIAELGADLAPYPAAHPRLDQLGHVLTLVDGTVLRGLARLAKLACGEDARATTSRDGRGVYGFRLHTQLELRPFRPHRIDRTGARTAGKTREANVLRRTLEAGRCYVNDGAYADRSLFDDTVAAGSSYVTRGAENSVFTVTEERLLSQEALDAGVVRDALVTLDGTGAKPTNHQVRRVEVQVTPHARRTRRGETRCERIILYTCLLDLPAELIALIYLQRYTVELFFRVLKQLLGMRHLLSQRPNGIDVQVQCTLIVCLLRCLIVGHRPDKTTRNMIGWYLAGLASEEELLAYLKRPDNTGVKTRAKDELWKKLGVK